MLWWLVLCALAGPGPRARALATNRIYSWQHILCSNVNTRGFTGSGYMVGIVEAQLAGSNSYRIATNDLVTFPFLADKIVYYHDDGAGTYGYSTHASEVAGKFVGTGAGSDDYRKAHRGPGLGVQIIHNYEANYFLNEYILGSRVPTETVINCSFLTTSNETLQQQADRMVDDEGKIITVGVDNQTNTHPVGMNNGYNVIAVGKTRDDVFNAWGHSQKGPGVAYQSIKPDIIAPGSYVLSTTQLNSYVGGTSYSTPFVAGGALLLVQAAASNGWASGADPRVVKSLLLSGAMKATNWNKGEPDTTADDHLVPLDYGLGAGCLNVLKSYEILADGPFDPSPSAPVDPAGWAFTTITNSVPTNVYLFDVSCTNLDLKATLTWHRHVNWPSVHLSDLDLELWSVTGLTNLTTRLDWSTSSNSAVEHLWYAFGTNTGRFAMTVVASDIDGGSTEAYALSWNVLTSTADDDFDEMPNWWEVQHFGGVTNADGPVDQDGDGHNNWEEWTTGTDPTSTASVFQVVDTDGEDITNGFVMTWSSVSNRHYSIVWSTNLYAAFSGLATNLDPTPPQNVYTDAVHSVESATYYKVSAHK